MKNKIKICEFCGDEKIGHHKYMKTCGKKQCFVKARQITNLEKYGHVSNLHGVLGKECVLNTLREKYGENITNVSQIQEVKIKKQKTCRKNYGVDFPMQSKDILQKSKEAICRKYGTDNVSKCKEIIDRIKNKMFEIDTETGLTIIETSKIKREKTYLEKYGFKHYFQTDEFKEKYKNKMLERYGYENYFQTDEFLSSIGKKRIDNKSEFQKYSNRIRNLTKKTFNSNFDIICNLFFRGREYHLDHIYSIYDGFLNSVDPIIMSSVVNLQLLPKKINLEKSFNSWQTIDELYHKYNCLTTKI